MIATPEDIVASQNEVAYWRNTAISERQEKLEVQSNYIVMALIALCEAGVIVALAYTRWRAGL